MCEIKEKVNMINIKRSLELAEALASVNLSSTRIRRHSINPNNTTYVPPKQVLLYLVR